MGLTPMSVNWGWRERAIEVVAHALSLVFIGPLQLLHWALSRILERILP
jgi:hypothetical protein